MAVDLETLRRLFEQATLIGLRGTVALAKFALALYTARYLGLADLGIYGLVAAALTIVPAVFGFGVTDTISRQVVAVARKVAAPLVTTRLSLSMCVHLVGQPLAWLLNAALGEPVPWRLGIPIGLILFLDHLASDTADMLILRGRVFFANVLLFVSAGLWPPAVIVTGLIFPATRNLDWLLYGWLASLIVTWLIIAAFLARGQRWRDMRLDLKWLVTSLRASVPFHIKDISSVTSLYLDRFLISFFLGLELTGVYTFFWSVANVAHSLVVYSIVQARMAQLVTAARMVQAAAFRTLERRTQIEVAGWVAMLAAGALVIMPILLPFLDRPLLANYLPVFWIMLLATVLRVGADGYSFALLALHRDRAILVIAVAGAIGSALANILMVRPFGIYGATLAYVLTSAGLLMARYACSRAPGDALRARPETVS
jgi:O-antigen/teichoic acid export membrane protein